jgi:hypothetical protein
MQAGKTNFPLFPENMIRPPPIFKIVVLYIVLKEYLLITIIKEL